MIYPKRYCEKCGERIYTTHTCKKSITTTAGIICKNGMCPYIPCEDFPDCEHTQQQLKFEEINKLRVIKNENI